MTFKQRSDIEIAVFKHGKRVGFIFWEMCGLVKWRYRHVKESAHLQSNELRQIAFRLDGLNHPKPTLKRIISQ